MKTLRYIIAFALIGFAAIHICFTLIYTLPASYTPSFVQPLARKYVAPAFDQGWSLFAPVPEYNKKVYISYQLPDSTWTKWESPFESYVKAHQRSRVSAYAKIVLTQSNILYYLWNENQDGLLIKHTIKGNPYSGYYRVLQNATCAISKKQSNRALIKIIYTPVREQSNLYIIQYPPFDLKP